MLCRLGQQKQSKTIYFRLSKERTESVSIHFIDSIPGVLVDGLTTEIRKHNMRSLDIVMDKSCSNSILQLYASKLRGFHNMLLN